MPVNLTKPVSLVKRVRPGQSRVAYSTLPDFPIALADSNRRLRRSKGRHAQPCKTHPFFDMHSPVSGHSTPWAAKHRAGDHADWIRLDGPSLSTTR